MTAPAWSPWRTLPLKGGISAEVLAEILDGGQSFRWEGEMGGSEWSGIWGDHGARVKLNPKGDLDWRSPADRTEETARALAHYFDAGTDSHEQADSLPWRSDAHLALCIRAFPGLRLLRQPLGETLLCFLCSAQKRIVQIKQMAAALALEHGKRIEALDTHRLPTWEELGKVSEAALRRCKLGFRARHIFKTSRFLAERPGWLEELASLPYPDSRERLCELPGVGEKVADCVLLYGGVCAQAFPVDIWILRAMSRRYGLEGWKPPQVAHFGRTHFGPMAGLAQQYLFAWERRFGIGR